MKLTAEERKQLAATFGCETPKLTKEIGKYAIAAQEEYLRMILGQRVFTRGQDILEYRLYLFIKNVFDGRLPSEQRISSLFPQKARTRDPAISRTGVSPTRRSPTTSI